MNGFVALTIPGRPVAKGRPRFTSSGHVYTPQATAEWEEVLQAQMKKVCNTPLEGPLELEIYFCFRVPVSWPKWKREAAEEEEPWYMGKPDLDNLIKLVKDAGNGILWRDDAQVVKLEAHKNYSRREETAINLMSAKGG